MTTTASPVAKSSPAVIAAWWPKFRLNPRTFTLGSAAAASARSRREPSRLPSSTKTISWSQSIASSTGRIAARSEGIASSSSKTGMTSESSIGP